MRREPSQQSVNSQGNYLKQGLSLPEQSQIIARGMQISYLPYCCFQEASSEKASQQQNLVQSQQTHAQSYLRQDEQAVKNDDSKHTYVVNQSKISTDGPKVRRTKYLKKIEQKISSSNMRKHSSNLRQVKENNFTNEKIGLVQSQQQFQRVTQRINEPSDKKQNEISNQNNAQESVQSLFHKIPKPKMDRNDQTLESFNSKRSLSRSLSEKNLQIVDQIEEDIHSCRDDEMNRTAQLPLRSLINDDFIQEFDKSYQDNGILQNIEAMVQQKTPISSSTPSQHRGNETVRREEPQNFGKNEKSQFDKITCQKNIDLEVILEFLIQEEATLDIFQQKASQGHLLEIQNQLPYRPRFNYLDLIQSVDCQKERPKYFAQQLQVTLVLVNTLVQIFHPPYLQRFQFSDKIRTVYSNIHQNFLLFIDQILNCCNANPKENLNYILLRKIIVKKLKNKVKSKRITFFRQNNEVNLHTLKKISKQIASNSSQYMSASLDQNLQRLYSKIGNEMLELQRDYDSIMIQEVERRLSTREEIVNLIQQQIQNSSPICKKKFNLRQQSPKISPRIHFSPTNSNKSDRNSDAFKSLHSTKNQQKKSKRSIFGKAVDQKSKGQSSKRSSVSDYDLIEEYKRAQEEESNYQQSNKGHQPFPYQNQSVFHLPESIAFLLSNSIECNNGITNINNNINIYNSPGVNINQLQTQAQNANIIGEINHKTGEIKLKPQRQLEKDSSQVKRTPFRPQKKVESKKQSSQSLINVSSKLNKSTQGGTSGQSLKVSQNKRQAVSRQNIKRDQSRIGGIAQNETLAPLEDEDLNSLSFNHVDLSKQTSTISQAPIKTKQLKSTNSSPMKGNLVNKTTTSQKNQSTTKVKDQKLNQSSINKSNLTIDQKSNLSNKRPQSRQLAGRQNSKKQLVKRQNTQDYDKNSLQNDGQNSVKQTPIKGQPQSYSTNKNNNQSKDYQPILQSSKKHSFNQQNVDKKSSLKVNQHLARPASKYTIQKSNIKLASPQPKAQKKPILVTANLSQEPKIASTSKKKPITNVQDLSNSKQNKDLEEFEHNEARNIEHYELQSDEQLKNQDLDYLHSVQDHQHSQCFSDKEESFPKDYDQILQQHESRLENLLNKMNEDCDKCDQRNKVSSLTQQHNKYHDQKQKQEEQHATHQKEFESKRQSLQFGTLLEEHMGSLDLKKEMEKLKQLDEDQKKKKRISLRIQSSPMYSQSQSGTNSFTNSVTNQESPTKRILLGEFDEVKDEESITEFNLKDDSHQTNESKKKSQGFDDIDQNELLESAKQSTLRDDNFSDKQSFQVETNKNNNSEEEQRQREKEEIQRLRCLVQIPYLPPLSEEEQASVYTLVLDLDETLIHFECDEDEEDEDEQGYYLIRPGAIKFLNELSKYYELVVFTAAMPDYADWILDNVDRNRIIKHRLYRQHTTPHEDYAIKDLHNIGRPLERTIIIDNLAENFIHTTPNNGIWVESWYDDMDDTILELLIPFLKDIVYSRVPDVRKLLTKHKKEKILYRCLEEGRHIPPVLDLLNSKPSSHQKQP